MKTAITKKVKIELKSILDQYGYWSEELRKYIEQFEYISSRKLHAIAQTYDKYKYGL